jgi:hypothetical protein
MLCSKKVILPSKYNVDFKKNFGLSKIFEGGGPRFRSGGGVIFSQGGGVPPPTLPPPYGHV